MKTLLFSGLVAAAAITTNASAGLAFGDTIQLTPTGINPWAWVSYRYDSSLAYNASNTSTLKTTKGGLLNFRDVATSATVSGFCVELGEGFPDNPITYTVAQLNQMPENSPPGPMNASQVSLMNELYDEWFSYGSVNNSADYAAAFQIVVWEIAHETLDGSSVATAASELSLATGAFTADLSASISTLANNMLATLGSGATFNGLRGLTNPTNQDLLVVVPTPAIAGLAGLGLVGMRRRRR